MFPLPKPYPDEIVGSVLIRTCRRFGISVASLSDQLFGSPRKFVPMLMSSSISRIAEASGVDKNAYLWKHTIFPYAIAFMPVAEMLRLHHKAILSNEPIQFGTLTYTVSIGVPYLRYCKVCIQEDQLVYGESYWHRSHLLPGTYVCTKHNTLLYETNLPIQRIQTSNLDLPQGAKGIPYVISKREVTMSIAKLSIEILNHQGVKESEDLLNQYRQLAMVRGYVKTGGFIASKPLARDLHTFYGQGLLQSLGCEFDWDSRSAWPTLMLREKIGIQFTTVKHVLLLTYLKHNIGKKETFDYQLPGPKLQNYANLDRKCANLAKKELVKNPSISLKYIAEKARCWSALRHNQSKFPLTIAAFEIYRRYYVSDAQLISKNL